MCKDVISLVSSLIGAIVHILIFNIKDYKDIIATLIASIILSFCLTDFAMHFIHKFLVSFGVKSSNEIKILVIASFMIGYSSYTWLNNLIDIFDSVKSMIKKRLDK